MHRRSFLNTVIAGGFAQLGGYTLFPDSVSAQIPKTLKVTALKVIPVWSGSMTSTASRA